MPWPLRIFITLLMHTVQLHIVFSMYVYMDNLISKELYGMLKYSLSNARRNIWRVFFACLNRESVDPALFDYTKTFRASELEPPSSPSPIKSREKKCLVKKLPDNMCSLCTFLILKVVDRRTLLLHANPLRFSLFSYTIYGVLFILHTRTAIFVIVDLKFKYVYYFPTLNAFTSISCVSTLKFRSC